MLHEVRLRCDAVGVLTAAAPASLACALEGWALLVVCYPPRKLPKEAGAGAQWSYGCQVHFWTPVVPFYQRARPCCTSIPTCAVR